MGSNDKDAPSSVGRSEAESADSRPFCIEPEAGKVDQHVSHPGRQQPWHVFADKDGGLLLFERPRDLWPEPALVSLGFASTRDADGLAGPPSAEDSDAGEKSKISCSDIFTSPRFGPVPSKHRSAKIVALDLPRDAAKPSSLKAQL